MGGCGVGCVCVGLGGGGGRGGCKTSPPPFRGRKQTEDKTHHPKSLCPSSSSASSLSSSCLCACSSLPSTCSSWDCTVSCPSSSSCMTRGPSWSPGSEPSSWWWGRSHSSFPSCICRLCHLKTANPVSAQPLMIPPFAPLSPSPSPLPKQKKAVTKGGGGGGGEEVEGVLWWRADLHANKNSAE